MTYLAVIGTILLLITFFTTRERIIPAKDQKSSLMEDLGDLVKNKPWVIVLICTTLLFVTLAMKGGSYVYYFENYVDKDALSAFLGPILAFISGIGLNFFGEDPVSAGFGLFNAGGIIFMIVGITLSKKYADKYGKRNVFGTALFISTLFILVFVLFPAESVGLMFISQILHGFFYGITIPLLWAMIADVADYSEWKNNRRATAIIFSAMMVGLKGGLSIGGSLVTSILGLYHYIPKEAIGANFTGQPESAVAGIKMLVSVYPSIPFFICVGLLFLYDIDKNMEVQIETDLKGRRLQ
jgi:Na+/melibiose symporter-like transporter